MVSRRNFTKFQGSFIRIDLGSVCVNLAFNTFPVNFPFQFKWISQGLKVCARSRFNHWTRHPDQVSSSGAAIHDEWIRIPLEFELFRV